MQQITRSKTKSSSNQKKFTNYQKKYKQANFIYESSGMAVVYILIDIDADRVSCRQSTSRRSKINYRITDNKIFLYNKYYYYYVTI